MRVGIIAEGKGDIAVLRNILRGRLGLDSDEFMPALRPELHEDETDRARRQETESRSNWLLVKAACEERVLIDSFLDNQLEEESLVTIHIDSAECEAVHYDVERPARDPDDRYCEELRGRIIDRINEWLGHRGGDRLRYAVAIEETEAWVLTIYSQGDTSRHRDPKKKLNDVINVQFSERDRKRLFQRRAYEQADELSRPFRKRKELLRCAAGNASLRQWIDSLPADPAETTEPKADD